ncbi:hypothetical protein F5B22DRAFT_641061 [Xylaria bambusicola]|uniref:uncharacterized protein n=1 Tax=Xylaria bambusicola TaxID=326684 RepID=UPI002008CC5E|nr:uncharacterized protein F5B22DRAFT_641061 [Xylaria bambusicola]KAI0528089.1 hypothetical protein F5B22DRAFT_641061 [Xylaria bambusicola]
MLFIAAFLASSLATLALGWPIFPLPCSPLSGTPCKCPEGTDYAESSTVAMIGASAGNVGWLMNNFFVTSWTGVEPSMTWNSDNIPLLSKREIIYPTEVGNVTIPEQLITRLPYLDGSFETTYQQKGIVPFVSGNGSFTGHWTTLKGTRRFENQTLVEWYSYSCDTGYPRNFAAFRENALRNATVILNNLGLLSGLSTIPQSI